MKKIITILLAVMMVLTLSACGSKTVDTPAGGEEEGAKTIYVMGPTPDHGWTAQAGAYAEKRCKELTDGGSYVAKYIPASSGE